jgi:hypothetical protein
MLFYTAYAAIRRRRLRTLDLRFWRPPLYQLSYTPKFLLYLCLLVDSMLSVKRTVLFEFQFFLGVSPVFAGGIVLALALSALKRYQFHHLLLTCHN